MRKIKGIPIDATTHELKWYEFDAKNKNTYPPKGLYIVRYVGQGNSIGAAYWDAYDKKKWTGFDIGEDGEMCEEWVAQYAEFPR